MLFVPSNASAEAWYYHITESPSYASYAKNLAMMALESWEDCGLINKTTGECIPLQFFPQPNMESCLEMRGFQNSCFVITWAREGDGDNVGYADYKKIFFMGEWIRLPGWHMQVSLGKTIQGTWYAFTDLTVENIAIHEVGHILGLQHNSDPDSIMYPTAVTQFKTGNFRPSTPAPAPAPVPAPETEPEPAPTPKPSGPVQVILNKLPPGGFQTGQAIPITGWVKNADPSHYVTITIIGPDKQTLKTTKAAISNQGTFSKAVFLSDHWPSGNYKFEVKYDSIGISKNFKFTQTSPPKTSPTPGTISPKLMVEKSTFELGPRENSYAKVFGIVPNPTTNEWVFFTTTEPDGKIIETKTKASTSGGGVVPNFENFINISGKKTGEYSVSVWFGVALKQSPQFIGTITFDVVEKPKGIVGLPSTISSIKTNKSSYSEDERIIISGSIKNYDSSHYNTVSIIITDSLGDRKFFKMVEPDSTGRFSITIPASIKFEDERYTVSALYLPLVQDYGGFYTYSEEQKITTSFEIVGGGIDSPNQKPHRDSESVTVIPHWVKTNAGWWAEGQIDDSSFLQGIQHLIKEGIMVIPPTETSKKSSSSQKIPEWIKNNAGWWADGQIDDNTFVSGIQHLVKVGIIKVS